jgi:ankyrin repeat protein
VLRLIEKDANINLKNYNATSALMIAAREGNADTVEILMDMNSVLTWKNSDEMRDIGWEDNNGMTAAIYAGSYGYPEVARLIEHYPEIKEQRRKEKELAEDIADFSAALKRPLPAPMALRAKP